MDIRKIKKLIEMLQDSDLTEIQVSEGEESVRISRGSNDSISVEKPLKGSKLKNEPNDEIELAGNKVKSPIVGTFYRRPAPEKPPYVKVGDAVKEGDVLCIVEAMKMMNEIKSEFSGKLISIIPEEGQPVEFDQTLFIIE